MAYNYIEIPNSDYRELTRLNEALRGYPIYATELKDRRSHEATRWRMIRAECNALPTHPIQLLMSGLIQSSLEHAESGQMNPEDSLFIAGASKEYARVITLGTQYSKRVGSGYFVESPHFRDSWLRRQPELVEEVIDGYSTGFRTGDSYIPAPIRDIAARYLDKWFTEKYKVPPTESTLNSIVNVIPVFFPFDHITRETCSDIEQWMRDDRAFVGKTLYYPLNYWRRVFDYMKAWYFPPVFWHSDSAENDFISYLLNESHSQGVSVSQFSQAMGEHERIHFELNRMVDLVVEGSDHGWLTESWANLFSTENREQLRNALYVRDPQEISVDRLFDDSKGVLYGQSLAFFKGILYYLSGDSAATSPALHVIFDRLAHKIDAIETGVGAQLKNSRELFYTVFPEAQEDSILEQVKQFAEKELNEAYVEPSTKRRINLITEPIVVSRRQPPRYILNQYKPPRSAMDGFLSILIDDFINSR